MNETDLWKKLEIDFTNKINIMYDYLGSSGFNVFKTKVMNELKNIESYNDAKKIFENIQSYIYDHGIDNSKVLLSK